MPHKPPFDPWPDEPSASSSSLIGPPQTQDMAVTAPGRPASRQRPPPPPLIQVITAGGTSPPASPHTSAAMAPPGPSRPPDPDCLSDARPPSTATGHSNAATAASGAAELRRNTPEPSSRPLTRAYLRQHPHTEQSIAYMGGGMSLPLTPSSPEEGRGTKRPRPVDDILNDATPPEGDSMLLELNTMGEGGHRAPLRASVPASVGTAAAESVSSGMQPPAGEPLLAESSPRNHEAKKPRRSLPIRPPLEPQMRKDEAAHEPAAENDSRLGEEDEFVATPTQSKVDDLHT